MSNLLYDSLFGCHAGDTKPFLIYDNGEMICVIDVVVLPRRPPPIPRDEELEELLLQDENAKKVDAGTTQGPAYIKFIEER